MVTVQDKCSWEPATTEQGTKDIISCENIILLCTYQWNCYSEVVGVHQSLNGGE